MQAREAVASDATVARHWWDTMAVIGYRRDATWLDRIRLRVVPSRDDVDHRRLQTVPPHRDTWGSGIMTQINWWLPLYPLVETQHDAALARCLQASHREHQRRVELRSVQERQRRTAIRCFRLPAGAPANRSVPVLIEPGQLLGFSAAHLHAGVSDAFGAGPASASIRARCGNRTARAGRGAPNVDGAAREEMWRWFRPPSVNGER